MNDEAWQVCAEPALLLAVVVGKASRRKLGLFACAYCRRLSNPLVDHWNAEVLPVLEAGLDESGPTTEYQECVKGVTDERHRLVELVAPIRHEHESGEEYYEEKQLPPEVEARHALAEALYWCAHFPGLEPYWVEQTVAEWRHWAFTLKTIGARDITRERIDELLLVEQAAQAELTRDIFPNPFAPAPRFDPAWRTSDVVAVARGIYDGRAFEGMPVLADALQEAGCDNDELLNHLRDTSRTHVRGCWALDLCLGLE